MLGCKVGGAAALGGGGAVKEGTGGFQLAEGHEKGSRGGSLCLGGGLRWTSAGLRFRHTRARRVAGRSGFDGEVIRWVSRGLAKIGARPCRALNPPYGTKKAAN